MNKHVIVDFDLDGTLGKFNEKIIELTGDHPRTLDQQGKLWSVIASTPNFFFHLEPYEDMVELFHLVSGGKLPNLQFGSRADHTI